MITMSVRVLAAAAACLSIDYGVALASPAPRPCQSDAAALENPQVVSVPFAMDPESATVHGGIADEIRTLVKECPPGALVTIRPTGDCGTPLLERTPRWIQTRFGGLESAESSARYAGAFANGAASALAALRATRSDLRYSVIGVPLEGASSRVGWINSELKPLLEHMDAIVSSKALLTDDRESVSRPILEASFRNSIAVAGSRPIYFRDAGGWRTVEHDSPSTSREFEAEFRESRSNANDDALMATRVTWPTPIWLSHSALLSSALQDVGVLASSHGIGASVPDRAAVDALPEGVEPVTEIARAPIETRDGKPEPNRVSKVAAGRSNRAGSVAETPRGLVASGSAGSQAAASIGSQPERTSRARPSVAPGSPSSQSGSAGRPESRRVPNDRRDPPVTPSVWSATTSVSATTPITPAAGDLSAPATAGLDPMFFDTSGQVLARWASKPFVDGDGRLWIGVDAWAPEGIDTVRFIASGAGTTSVMERRFHPDRRAWGYWVSISPGDVQGNSVSVTASVIPRGLSPVVETPPMSVTRSGGRWAAEQFQDGWTKLVPSPDSRLIYVSNAGDDTAAANVYGRGYYLPSDPEIGPDPTNPLGPIAAYRTAATAKTKMRTNPRIDNNPGAERYPDWMLFGRGDEFAGVGSITGSVEIGGPSDVERRVYAAWGDPTQPRPRLLDSSIDMWGSRGGGNAAFVSLDLPGAGVSLLYGASNILIEDCRLSGGGLASQIGSNVNIAVRRCVVSGRYNPNAHVQGMFVSGDGEITIEECVFDRNGYKEDPDDATTWTAGAVSTQTAGAMPAGTGVQPTRTYFDRNLYLSSYDSMTLRGNIISRGGGGGSVQMRQGGVADRNLFIWNEGALGMSHPQADPLGHLGSLVKDNVVLHDDHLLPPGGWGTGLTGGGADDDLAVLDGNIVSHFHRGNNGGQSLGVSGKSYYRETRPASKLMRGIVKDNAIYREFGGVGIMVMDDVHDWGTLAADVTGNAVSTPSQLSMQGNNFKPATFTYSNNRFHSTTAEGLFRWGWESNSNGDWRTGPWTDGTFSQWQSAGFDTDGTFTNDFAAFKAAAGWVAPERDIVSYMQSVDPTYVVDEDVYVDADASVKQAVRQKVWEVLANNTAWPGAMADAQAKLTARRYHAFITFIQRAKANRKGAWDTRWTAEAVNNYIREGFGKAPVTGPYTTTLSDLANYTPITP